MVRALVRVSLLMGLVACSDYGYTPGTGASGTPNPPDLEAPVVADRVVQSPISLVDVLFVVDTSCSMVEEQTALAENMPSFMQFFLDSGLDYHLGVVATNLDTSYANAGRLRYASNGENFITPETANPLAIFEEMAVLGTDSHYLEKGRAAAYTALVTHRETHNRGFYREDATLSVVVISDENDASGDAPISREGFIDWLDTLKGADASRTSFSGIVSLDLSCATISSDVGSEYVAVAEATGGVLASICTDRWDRALEELGMEAAGIRREFFLSQVPVEDSLVVEAVLDGGDVISFDRVDVATPEVDWGPEGEPAEYVYDRSRNSVRFVNLLPPPLSQVFLEYEPLAVIPVGAGAEAESGR